MKVPIEWVGLTAEEWDRVARLEDAIRRRFAAAGVAVSGCRAAGRLRHRTLCVTRTDGRMAGYVSVDEFLAAPDARALKEIHLWRD